MNSFKRNRKSSVSVLIPAYNEERNIKRIVEDCFKIKEYKIKVLVVIDNKTIDKTEVLAKKTEAKTIRLGKGLGKGEIFRLAIPYLKSDFVVQIDADYQFLPNEIPKLVKPLISGFDVALGTRYQKGSNIEKGSVTVLKLFGSYFLSFVTSVFAKQRITDVMAGFKGFKYVVLEDLNPQTDHFGYEAELVIKAAQRKYKIVNIPISYKKRVLGTSNVHLIKHGLLVFETILKIGLKKYF